MGRLQINTVTSLTQRTLRNELQMAAIFRITNAIAACHGGDVCSFCLKSYLEAINANNSFAVSFFSLVILAK